MTTTNTQTMVTNLLDAADAIEQRGDRLINIWKSGHFEGKAQGTGPTPDIETCADGAIKLYRQAHELRLQAARLEQRAKADAARERAERGELTPTQVGSAQTAIDLATRAAGV